MTSEELKRQVDPFLKFLRDRFRAKIKYDRYYLSYSGGKDSHFLYWFIKEYLQDDKIEIVGVNTGFEIPEIRERIMRNADIVLHPCMKRGEIKERYGIPCYSKTQDEYIHRYQNGSRSDNTMRAILGENVVFNLNKSARDKLLSGTLHKVSNKCCLYSKEKPMAQYAKETGKKAIIGVRQSESKLRKAKYDTCLQSNGNFSPIYDFSDLLIEDIYRAYDIEVPSCYNYVQRTGCAGCPYGRNCEDELALLPEKQRNKVIEYFKESYDAKGIEYENIQEVFRFNQ